MPSFLVSHLMHLREIEGGLEVKLLCIQILLLWLIPQTLKRRARQRFLPFNLSPRLWTVTWIPTECSLYSEGHGRSIHAWWMYSVHWSLIRMGSNRVPFVSWLLC